MIVEEVLAQGNVLRCLRSNPDLPLVDSVNQKESHSSSLFCRMHRLLLPLHRKSTRTCPFVQAVSTLLRQSTEGRLSAAPAGTEQAVGALCHGNSLERSGRSSTPSAAWRHSDSVFIGDESHDTQTSAAALVPEIIVVRNLLLGVSDSAGYILSHPQAMAGPAALADLPAFAAGDFTEDGVAQNSTQAILGQERPPRHGHSYKMSPARQHYATIRGGLTKRRVREMFASVPARRAYTDSCAK